MNDIELQEYFAVEKAVSDCQVSAPRIHWSWMQANDYFRGTLAGCFFPWAALVT